MADVKVVVASPIPKRIVEIHFKGVEALKGNAGTVITL